MRPWLPAHPGRWVLDPGDLCRCPSETCADGKWTLAVATEMADRVRAGGLDVFVTRTSTAFVPTLVRAAYAREVGAEGVLGLYAAVAEAGAPALAVHRPWWQLGSQAAMQGRLVAALRALLPQVAVQAADASLPPHRELPVGVGPTRLCLVVRLPGGPGRAPPSAWADSLAAAFATALLGDAPAAPAARVARPLAAGPAAVTLVPGVRQALNGPAPFASAVAAPPALPAAPVRRGG